MGVTAFLWAAHFISTKQNRITFGALYRVKSYNVSSVGFGTRVGADDLVLRAFNGAFKLRAGVNTKQAKYQA
jgi:hypothetical protein